MSSAPKHQAGRTGCSDPPWLRGLLLALALLFAGLFLVLPVVNLFVRALELGFAFYGRAVSDPDSRAAVRLTLIVALVVVPLNTLFGLAAAWGLAKFKFRGRTWLTTLIDLPFAVSPVVAGLMLLLLFGRTGWLGPWITEHNVQILFALPAMILATLFVTCPLIARELIPTMQAMGDEQEQAALTLGASGWQTFWHVTLPAIKGSLVYGIILCNARAMGEFGAVSIVSGRITGLTDTLPLRVEKLYHGATQASATAAFAVASLLALLALLTLVAKTFLDRNTHSAHSAR